MYKYRVTEITLSDGTVLPLGALTVLVGPNNVGKSRALRDVVAICAPPEAPRGAPRPLLVTAAKWTSPSSLSELEEREKLRIFDQDNGQRVLRWMDPNLSGERNFQVTGWETTNYLDLLKTPTAFAKVLGGQFLSHLSTQNRLQLCNQQQSPTYEFHTTNLIHQFYWAEPAVQDAIYDVVRDQFGLHLALDYSTLVNLCFRVAREKFAVPDHPKSASAILGKLERLDDQGDGLKAFVGMLVALRAADRDTFLVDEPEAFLHPPQAIRIGELLAEYANEERQVLVATHSADVLQGVISRAPKATIVRIDRHGNTNVFRRLDESTLLEITRDPLLQSARVLDGIFYPAAVVVEADSDARFLSAAWRHKDARTDFYAVNAQNKQTLAKIARVYRSLGIRCVGLADIDVLNDESELERHLEVLGMPRDLLDEILKRRARIASEVENQPAEMRLEQAIRGVRDALTAADGATSELTRGSASRALKSLQGACRAVADSSKPWSRIKSEGIDGVTASSRTEFVEIWKACAAHGMVINPFGELESLLSDQGIPYTTDKRAWISSALQLVPNLRIEPERRLWRLVSAVAEMLGGGSPEVACTALGLAPNSPHV